MVLQFGLGHGCLLVEPPYVVLEEKEPHVFAIVFEKEASEGGAGNGTGCVRQRGFLYGSLSAP